MILLTPGPLTTSPTVKAAMLRDLCTWDADYNHDIVQDVRQQLVGLATRRPDEYTAVLLQGSGTYCVEAAIGTAVGPDDRLLVLANGAYGHRMCAIAHYYGIAHDALCVDEREQPAPAALDRYLDQHPDTTHVAFVHCETTTGILNPLQPLAATARRHGCTVIVDAMSSFGGIPLDVAQLDVDFLISSANKCIQGVPGFGFVLARRTALAACAGHARSLSLDLYDQWRTMEEGGGKWRFTSPTHVVCAFRQALVELHDEGGVPARHQRYQDNHRTLVDGMRARGYRTLLADRLQSPIITSFLYPRPDFDFRAFYEQLKAHGFVIYPGKISQAATFRIGNIGDIVADDMRRLLDIMPRADE